MHFHFLARVVRSVLLRKRVKDKSRVMADSQTANLTDEAAYTLMFQSRKNICREVFRRLRNTYEN